MHIQKTIHCYLEDICHDNVLILFFTVKLKQQMFLYHIFSQFLNEPQLCTSTIFVDYPCPAARMISYHKAVVEGSLHWVVQTPDWPGLLCHQAAQVVACKCRSGSWCQPWQTGLTTTWAWLDRGENAESAKQ